MSTHKAVFSLSCAALFLFLPGIEALREKQHPSLLQGEPGAEDLASIHTSPIELTDDMKVTFFAPEDAAWSPAAGLPQGGMLLDVWFLLE
jgi:hypothetical protein